MFERKKNTSVGFLSSAQDQHYPRGKSIGDESKTPKINLK